MGIINAPNVVRDGLVLAVDAANVRSFRGEPTTNYSRNVRDFSGTAYASDNEWSSDPTRLTKSYISTIQTPIGNGATLIYESGTAGYHHLSRYGGGDESGAHSISCYVRPVTTDITEFMIGMLGDGSNSVYFNLNTLAISYGGGISNRNAFIETVPGYPGWYRVGANIEGRAGGWVGSVGYSIHTSYTGTLGNKRCYITGIQYEFTSKPTQFLEAQATRGTTNATGGGWVDLSGNGNHGELVNGPTYNSNSGGSIVFDGSNDYINLSSNIQSGYVAASYEFFIETGALPSGTYYQLYIQESSTWMALYNYGGVTFFGIDLNNGSGWFDNNGGHNTGARTTTTLQANTKYHIVYAWNGSQVKVYLNGNLESTTSTLQAANGRQNVTSLGAGTTPRMIGSRGAGTNVWNGKMYQVRFYSKELSANEVLQNFNSMRDKFGV